MPRTATQEKPVVTSGVFKLPIHLLKLVSEAPPDIRAMLQVRKSDDSAGLEELEASLRHHGVIYPLIIDRSHGADYTVAGNRRLKCLRKILGDTDAEIDVVDVRDFRGDEREIAMAVNIALPPHPVDRYEVLATQIHAGLSPEDVAARNAMTLQQVSRVLALAELAPEIRDAWRDSKIDTQTAQAFTLAPDKAEQVKFFNTLMKSGHLSAWQIHEKFVKNRDAGTTLEFVGIEAYEKCGGTVRRDLFGKHHTVSDEKLLGKLFQGRMTAECEKLVKEGWSFAVPAADLGNDRYSYSQIEVAKVTMTKAERERHAELTARVEASDDDFEADSELEALDEAVKLRAYTDSHKKRSGCILSMNSFGQLEVQYGKVKPAERSKAPAAKGKKAGKLDAKGKPAAPEASGLLKARLERQLLAGTAAAIVAASQGSKGLGPLLGRIVAKQIGVSVSNTPPTVAEQLDALRKLIDPKIMQHAIWQAFDDKDYFNSVPKDLIAAAVSESMSTEHATKVRGMGKELAAKFAIANVTKTGWLPRELRVPGYQKVKRK
jgi:ParB family transcriptional regulator, chromosome partitioning protein